MKKIPDYSNDQAHIAQEFLFIDEHTAQTARLAFFKVNSYKLSLFKNPFVPATEELFEIIRSTLLNYEDLALLLTDLGFFDTMMDS